MISHTRSLYWFGPLRSGLTSTFIRTQPAIRGTMMGSCGVPPTLVMKKVQSNHITNDLKHLSCA
jgi:hypothetical protein